MAVLALRRAAAIALVVAAGCRGDRAPTVVAPRAPAPEPSPAPGPTLADALSAPRTFHLLRVAPGGDVVCEAWQLEPDGDQRVLHSDDLRLELDVSAPDALQVRSFARPAFEGVWSNCHPRFTARVVDGGLEVGHSTWFDDAAGCEAARSEARPVAFHLGTCEMIAYWDAGAGRDDAMRGLRERFRQGGALWFVDTDACASAKVRKARRVAGALRSTVTLGEERWQVDLDLRETQGTWSQDRTRDGGGVSLGSLTFPIVPVGPAVDLFDHTLYLDEPTCVANLRYRREVARWTR